MGTGCGKVTSEDMMGALPSNGEAKELKEPHSTSQRPCQGLWGPWWVAARMRKEGQVWVQSPHLDLSVRLGLLTPCA